MERPHDEDEVPLTYRRSTSQLSQSANDDLRAWVRSLLVLHNKHFPPRVPAPSPEYNRSPYSTDEVSAKMNKTSRLSSRESPHTSAAPRSSQSLVPSMAIHRFDGTAAQLEDDHAYTPRRYLSQPDFLKDANVRPEDTTAPELSEQNQRHEGTAVGQGSGGIAELPPIPQRSPFNRTSGRFKPHYDVRTLPPASPGLTEKYLRPSMQHVPGSYRSELPQSNQREASSSPAIDGPGEDIDRAQPKPQGSHTASPSSAIKSLNQAQEYSGPLPARPSVRSVRSSRSLKPKTSHASLRSNFSSKALLQLNLGRPNTGQVAEPIVTTGMSPVHSHSNMAASAGYAGLQGKPESQLRCGNADIGENDLAKTHEIVSSTDTQVWDLLAQLPPVKQITVDELDFPSLMVTSSSDPNEFLAPQRTREHSREVSSHEEREDQDFKDRPDLPSKTTEPLHRVPREGKAPSVANAQSPSTPGTPKSSASQKASSLSRALTALSQISSKSNGSGLRLSTLRSPTKYEKLDDDVVGPTSQSQYQDVGTRSNWVRDFVGRSSTSPISATPNLTSGPPKERRKAPNSKERLYSRTMPVPPRSLAASDENAFQNQSVRDAMKNLAIARHQQDNADSFSKVILDLENLLEEALVVAHRASHENKSTDGTGPDRPLHPESPTSFYTESTLSSDNGSMHSGGRDEEDHRTSETRTITQPAHDRIAVIEPEENDRYHGHFRKARDPTPYPPATRNASVVPPTEQEEPLKKQPSFGGGLGSAPQRTFEQALERQDQQKSINSNGLLQPPASRDWAVPKRQPTMKTPEPDSMPLLPRQPTMAQAPLKEQNSILARKQNQSSHAWSEQTVHREINGSQKPTDQPRARTFKLRPRQKYQGSTEALEMRTYGSSREGPEAQDESDSDDPESKHYKDVDKHVDTTSKARGVASADSRRESTLSPLPDRHYESEDQGHVKQGSIRNGRRSHFSIKEPQGFSLSRSHKRAPIARDWSDSRKRWTATIACISTALIGLIIGIYAGEVPAIQYAIVDEHHYTILGNVVLFIGLAISTFFFFPLPLLHGRKPYTLAALAILLPLQFPQALAVNTQRTPLVATYRVGLLLLRAIAGLIIGFANINFLSTLLDLFGASLQSSNPHQEEVDVNDVRRHGGGMGMWLGIWTWCFIGSIGLGFFIGAVIISGLDVSWGFWITIILTAAVLVLNVLAPETRRSAYRRSMAEVRNGGEVSRRIARGEIKMHLDATGPIYWWEEVTAGQRLCLRMLKQPGFAILSLYLGWIYGQIVIVIVVSLMAR